MSDKTTTDYPYIRIWGNHLGSYSDYIEMEVDRAHEEGAPQTAYHRNPDGTWSTTDTVFSTHLREVFGLEPLEITNDNIYQVAEWLKAKAPYGKLYNSQRWGLVHIFRFSNVFRAEGFVNFLTPRVDLLALVQPIQSLDADVSLAVRTKGGK